MLKNTKIYYLICNRIVAVSRAVVSSLLHHLKTMENKTEETWRRPENVPYPSIWARFEGKEINGMIPKFWVQDTPEEEFDNIVEIMITRFMPDEPISSCSKIFEDEKSIETMRKLWKDVLQQKLTICCYMENPTANGKPILAGLNCTYVTSRQNKANLDRNEVGNSAYSILYTVEYSQNGMKNPFDELKMDHLLGAMGLYVFPEFRGQALGKKIIEAREPLSKAVGLPATITVFTSPISQKLAARCGFQVFTEISFAELMRINPKVRFDDIEKKSVDCKCMYKIY